jgi:phosphatidyl-myo-inositol dimannoside synthase
MKSLLITHDFPPGVSGGISVFLHHLCAELKNEINVLAPRLGKWKSFDSNQDYTVFRQSMPIVPSDFMSNKKMTIWQILYLVYIAVFQFSLYIINSCRIVIREKIDVILIGHLYLAPVAWFIQLITKRPYVIVLHGSELHRYWRFRLARMLFLAWLNRAEFLLVNSEFTQRQYLNRGVQVNQTFVLVSPGVDVDRFHPELSPTVVLRRHALKDRSVILTVARLVESKGQDNVIRAMSRVIKVVPNAVYIMVGSGPHRAVLEKLVAEFGLQKSVIFSGFIPDSELGLYYAAANIMVLVGREFQPGMPVEGFGIAYIEANAVERPVIGSNIGATPDTIVNGVTGLLVSPDDEEELATSIIRLLVNPELAKQIGKNGRERVVREFTWQTQAIRLQRKLTEIGIK